MRILIAAHGHPRFSPGGGENAAYALFQALSRLQDVECCFLAAADESPIPSGYDLFGLSRNEWLVRRSSCSFFHLSSVALHSGSDFVRAVLEFAPDVIHFHHFHGLGLDLIHALRRWCPRARLVLTLHEFLALCPFNGQLLKRDGRLCDGSIILECMHCLVERSSEDLLIREHLILSALRLMDDLVSPSQYLIDRWESSRLGAARAGLPRPVLIENLLNLRLVQSDSSAETSRRHRVVFGFFGNLIPSKGIDLLLEAWIRLVSLHPHAHLIVHGSQPQYLDGSSFSRGIKSKLKLLGGRITMAGRYDQNRVSELMTDVDWVVMASLWPENSPVVIEEAKACGRPLLVPSLGGMAEKVRNGKDGLHYTPHSAFSLSEVMLRCCNEAGLWPQLHATLAKPASVSDVLAAHMAVYNGGTPGLTPD